ncbi:NAD(P)-dependent dehydrogenase (short-subunit alcohol dehydrogenase family) [Pseudomonas duriflava]|uniref:NAD(P)-dependent dehydrogenase (Short-subunit alcohol dehydrogenase family) n=1 Tax=Pseudomonas duriflava TaxID=459528 RepID=A0A562PUV5_9PSED|nr:SDR family oxidoreductase [Pseudomonas duriflava]TWI48242.1 NAD(P)-dependent dehydrogenase (short-subunit alcohol dehydrogenase family) [Pseudomonas duriflava]
MKIDLSGKRALVTASTGGIGYSIAKGLAKTGAMVIINGRSDKSVNDAVVRLQTELPGASISGIAADLGSAQGAAALVSSAGEIDVLVNNAGIYSTQDFFETNDEVWDQYWDTNVMSGVRLSRALLPAMIEKGWGRVVFVASESARNIPADMIHYGVSKTAQLGLARGLAKRVAGSGVTVNSVLPGPTLSDGVSRMMQAEVERTGKSLEAVVVDFIKEHRPTSIIQRAATTEEVANLIVYVCSPQASATTGASLRVDGGVVDDIV